MSTKIYRSRTRPETTEPPTSELVFLTVNETASFLRISPVTLGRWRIEGCGPAYRKFGRRVVYGRADVAAGAEAQRRASTSELNLQRGDQP